MKKTYYIIVGVFIVLFFIFVPKIIKDQQIRDKCYAIGIKYMPPTTDQSLLQSVPEYQACLQKGMK